MNTEFKILNKTFCKYQHSLLGIAEDLHMYLNGADQTHSAHQLYIRAMYIEESLRNWRTTSSRYDQAVEVLLRRVLEEYYNGENYKQIKEQAIQENEAGLIDWENTL